jgi:RNA-binding motif X-linked protein 2
MNVIKEIQRLNERELEQNVPYEGSWHHIYRESAWIYVGSLSFELTEGDILCVFSQVGEIEDINLVRDKKTGKSMGFAFIKYENHLSTVLAVDNFNGASLLDRMLRVDHVHKYKLPKDIRDKEDEIAADEIGPRGLPGHAYEGKEMENKYDIHKGVDVFKVKLNREEKKKLKKQKKRAKKSAKRQVEIEAKQTAYIQEIKRMREQRAEEEEREKKRRMTLEGISDPSEFVFPSAMGWRGRYEPDANPIYPTQNKPKQDASLKPEATGYGGIARTR